MSSFDWEKLKQTQQHLKRIQQELASIADPAERVRVDVLAVTLRAIVDRHGGAGYLALNLVSVEWQVKLGEELGRQAIAAK